MSTKSVEITVAGVAIRVIRKDIKNLHLGVYPPHGRVRVAAPLRVSDEAVRLAVISKLGWIKKQRAKFASQHRQSKREMVSGESHYFLGRRYRLSVVMHKGLSRVATQSRGVLELQVRPKSDADVREGVLLRWYRRQLRELVPPLAAKWQRALGVNALDWRIKKMKTRWGTCSVDARRIWLNLELAKKPVECLEYLVVHELVHLIEPHHNERFVALMDQNLPLWRHHRKRLNEEPLGHAEWSY
jgi:predicted metal-dependent hydrolase